MKKLCSVLLALALFCCVPTAHALDHDALTPSSLAFITVVNSEIDSAAAGFIVAMTPDTTYILTETAIMMDGKAPYLCFKMLFNDSGEIPADRLIQPELVWVDSTVTIALLSVDTTEDIYGFHRLFPALAPLSSVNNGDTLHRVGLDITENNSNWSPVFSVYTTGTAIVSSNYPSGQFSMTSAPGAGNGILDMGGPVIDEQGVVVGISAHTVVDGKLNNEFIICMNELMDYLDSEGIPYATRGYCGKVTNGKPGIVSVSETGSGAPSGGSGTPSGGSDGTSGGSGHRGGSTGSSGGSSSGGLFEDALSGGGIGLAAAGGAGVYFWLKKKKGTPAQSGRQTAGHTSGTVSSGALVLVGVGGQMDGCRFPLQGANLSFGRDPSRCAIIYDSGAPGVSSLHCQLICQEGTWQLIDLESSFGTYLNGRKLEPFAPNPLRPGDTFWLGQPQNSFTLREE